MSRRLDFDRIEQLRAHDYVAEQLRRHIALHLVGRARALPPERELARVFGVGRATVQRAIGLLEVEGLVERRRGRHGGTFVVAPAEEDGTLQRVITRLRRERSAIEEALVYRLEVEPGAAAIAALRRTDEELDAIAAWASAAAEADTDAEFMEHDTAFHLAIARATHNRFFSDSVERVRRVLNDALVALPDSAVWHEWSERDHELVVVALAGADARAARRAMGRHVAHTDASVRALLASV